MSERPLSQRRLTRAALLCAGLAVASLAPSVARAQEATPAVVAEARSAFERGVTALDEQRFGEAVTAFRESYRLRPRPVVLNNLALAYRGAGRYREAIESFERYLAERSDRLDAAEAQQTRAEVERLRGSLATLVLHIDAPSAEVLVDGVPAENAGAGLSLDPGDHVVEVRAPGRLVFRRVLTLEVRSRTTLPVRLERARFEGQLAVTVVPEAAEVLLDGSLAPREQLRAGLRLLEGPHRLSASLDGYSPVEREVTVRRDELERVALTLTPLSSERPAASPEGPRGGLGGAPSWVVPVAVSGGAALAVGGTLAALALAGVFDARFEPGTWGGVRER